MYKSIEKYVHTGLSLDPTLEWFHQHFKVPFNMALHCSKLALTVSIPAPG